MSDPAVDLPVPDSASLAGATNQSVRLSPLAAEVATLFDRYRSPLLRYLQSFGIAPHDGEEVVQEVFMALYQHLEAGRPRTNLAGWLFRVAHNQGLKRCMANQRMATTGPIDEGMDLLERADPAPNPEQQVHAKQRQQRLLAVVDALPENDRRVLYLRAEGLRYREIAEVLGISLGGVAQSLERSVGKLLRADERE